MAFLPSDPNQEQDHDEQQGQPAGAAPVIGSPGATPIAGAGQGSGGQAQTGAQPAAKPSSSGSFTNLMNYVGANKGNDAAMAGTVRQNTEAKANTAQQAGTTFKTTAEQQADAATVRDQGVIRQVRELPRAQTTKAGAPPPIDQNQFNAQYNAQYTGPKAATEINGYGDTGQQYQKVEQYGKLAGGDMSDRGALLTDAYGQDGKRYNTGERRLDSFILGAGEQGQQAMQQIAQDYGNYDQNFQNILGYLGNAQDGTGRLGQAAKETDRTRQATRAAVAEAEAGYDSAFRPLIQKANDATDRATDIYEQLSKGDKDAWLKNGMSAETYDFLQGLGNVGWSNLASMGDGYKLGDYASKDQQTGYTGLMNLLTGAGEADRSKYSFDKGTGGFQTKKDVVRMADELRDDWTSANTAASTSRGIAQGVQKQLADDPKGFLDTHGAELGLSPTEISQLKGLPPEKIQEVFAPQAAASVGDYLAEQGTYGDFQQLFKHLGLDPNTPLRRDGGKSLSTSPFALDQEKLKLALQSAAPILGNLGNAVNQAPKVL
jgi:hypothetical protein